ncbi:MAG: response regulator [bacterium]|nr:response regulator [bacterium]
MKKILIVDDQPEVRELVTITLKNENYKILEAKDGQESIDIIKKEKPDIILLDIMLPGEIDGFEVCRRVKQDEELKNISVVMLSSQGAKEDIKEGKCAGANDYFVKPFSPLQLIKKVEDLLGG